MNNSFDEIYKDVPQSQKDHLQAAWWPRVSCANILCGLIR